MEEIFVSFIYEGVNAKVEITSDLDSTNINGESWGKYKYFFNKNNSK
jgi:hypothetical protein